MEKMKGRDGKLFALIAFSLVILDQLTKLLVVRSIGLHQKIDLIPNFLSFTYVQNTGAGFGILQGQNLLLAFIALIIIGLILFYIKNILANRYYTICFALIFSGALGNLTDRIFRGYVVDFVNLAIWPAFNVADSAISIGAVLLIIFSWKTDKK
ncbi:MAG TPA: signal peptidase II [Candidatus Nanoarchaeia archaeon]|nr:signal peptidase II [Candidatus Nanoarchaeia archaeon]